MYQFTYLASSSSYLTTTIFIILFLASNFFQFSTTDSLDGYFDCRYSNYNYYDVCPNGYRDCLDYANYNYSDDACPNGVNINYPFWYMKKTQEQKYYCGYPGFGITCSPSGKPIINISNQSYYLIQNTGPFGNSIPGQITIVDPDFVEKTCPRPHQRNLTFNQNYSSHPTLEIDAFSKELTFFFNCTSAPPPQIVASYLNVDNHRSHHLECLDYKELRSYAFLSWMNEFEDLPKLLADWKGNYCRESVVVPVDVLSSDQVYEYIQMLQKGFLVDWSTPIECQRCERSGGFCSYNETASSFRCWCDEKRQLRHRTDGTEYCFNYGALRKKILIGVFTGVGGLMFITLLFVYHMNQRKRRRSLAKNVEQFLERYGCHSFQRYKYRDIKKMTNSFKDKLGQGGYGSVFKGKLIDGRPVAVKVLINDPKKSTNGEDFINEVATIGRTNHVNIVALLGYCSSGSKRALVYEFMPKGSLEKFIYAKDEENTAECTSGTTITSASSNVEGPLGWEKLYQIALGIARGLEYLHRGCNTGQILHFDIKPHNILLDENLCPKISDFGLAKLCPTRESIVSMLSGGRGTIGYIAPEVYNRNFGGVSHKSDVYSYGMMVLEMVGGRKNIDPFVDNTSEIYFPHWIYNRLEKHKDRIEDLLRFEEAFDEEIARKMIMVGLWCIQTSQADRPSMARVSEMLEGSLKDLQMPPNPYLDPCLPTPSIA